LYIFSAWKKRARFGVYLFIPIQKPDPKQGIKKIPKTFSSTFVPSLTLQISYIVQSSLESPTLEFSLIICLTRDLDVWSRGKGKSSFVMQVIVQEYPVVGKCLRNFLIPCFWSACVSKCRNVPKTVRKKYTTFSTERIVALRSVNKKFPESYDFAAMNLYVH
jgi:hypothetical protein